MIAIFRLDTLALMLCASLTVPVPAEPDTSGMKLVFTDDFTRPPLDLAKWHVGSQPNGRQWGSDSHFVEKQEPEFSATYSISSGVLRIRATYDPSYVDPQKSWKRKWYSGLIIPTSADGAPVTFRKGCIAVRMQLPAGKGVWPAVWAMNALSAAKAPDLRGNVELDGLEAYGALLPHRFSSTTHDWKNPANGGKNPTVHAIHDKLPEDLTSGMHDYAWCTNASTFSTYLDGRKLSDLAIPRADTVDPFYWMINLSMGGGWPITVPGGNHYYLHVDSVRIWSAD